MYDRAFDIGYMTFGDEYRVVLSKKLQTEIHEHEAIEELFKIEGKMLNLPHRFQPDIHAIRYHRKEIFQHQGK